MRSALVFTLSLATLSLPLTGCGSSQESTNPDQSTDGTTTEGTTVATGATGSSGTTGPGATTGQGATAGSGATTGQGATAGPGATTGQGATTGPGATTGQGATTTTGGVTTTGSTGVTGTGGASGATATTGTQGAGAATSSATSGMGGATGTSVTASTAATTAQASSASSGVAASSSAASSTSSSTGGGTAPTSDLPLPPGAGNVAKPSGATATTITVLNWAGFKGAVSYTLDDDNDSQIANYATLEQQGIPYTFFMWTNRTEASNSVWVQAVKDGHEIGNHTASHSSTPPGGVADINSATTFIKQHFNVTPYTMAAPNGAAVYTGLANGLFMINRGVADSLIMPNGNTDRFTLPCYIPATGAPTSSFNSEVDSAQSAGAWRVILVHGFTGGNDGAYQPVDLAAYTGGIQHAKSLGNMWIGTLVDVGAYWLGQKAFTAATTATAGNAKTFTWKLPSNFAPGKFLRVTITGGTLTQKGQTLPWNDHGFYEIALDDGAVTLGP